MWKIISCAISVKIPAASGGALEGRSLLCWGNLSPKPPNKDAIPPHRKQWGILASFRKLVAARFTLMVLFPMAGMAIFLVSVRSTGWTRSLTTMAAGDSLLLGLFLANSSTDSDQQHYLCSTTKKQGISQETQVTALADGAKNCWSVLAAIQPECATLECILDWFHIVQKFQNVKNALGEAFAASLESAKWKLWHGNTDDALTKLALLRDNVSEEAQRSKLTGLYEYIHRNQAYIVNYEAREQANKTYTSQVAESHIDALINARHKRTKKMQWTREGAHHVLQIRAMMASDEWESTCQGAVLSALGAVA